MSTGGRENEVKRTAAETARNILIGKIVKAGRLECRPDKPYNQEEFYRACRKLESPEPGTRKGVAFPSNDKSGSTQRRFFVHVETGKKKLKPAQKRLIEQVCKWPPEALDGRFTTEEEFVELCNNLQGSAHLPPPKPSVRPKTFADPSLPEDGEADQLGPRRLGGKPNLLAGIKSMRLRRNRLPTRAELAKDIQEALVPRGQETLLIVALQGEAGIGKTELIAEWWRDYGKTHFSRNTFSLDCSRLAGDQILPHLSSYFLSSRISVPTTELVDSINALDGALIVLDGLSDEDEFGLDNKWTRATSGRADRISLRSVRELIDFLAINGARTSILLGIQASPKSDDFLRSNNQLTAAANVVTIRVPRLPPEEGVKLARQLIGTDSASLEKLSDADLRYISEKLEGLPISIAAACHHLRHATDGDVEKFLTSLGAMGRNFQYFENFFRPYLSALNTAPFNPKAHPEAYLRLLALMPGSVTKQRIDDLLSKKRIVRLEEASTHLFSSMRIAFISERGSNIDINPMVRGLLRQEIKKDSNVAREELYWIHASAAAWCMNRLPDKPAEASKVGIELIEGALYHLLELLNYLPVDPVCNWHPKSHKDAAGLLDGVTSSQVTEFCLNTIVRPFLIDRHRRTTRILGQYETKARLLSLFVENVDDMGRPRHLSIPDQASVFNETGVCWMHAGRLQLAQHALDRAALCFAELDVRMLRVKPFDTLTKEDAEIWQSWSSFISTSALVLMRRGRSRGIVEDAFGSSIEFANRLYDSLDDPLFDTPLGVSLLRSARRVYCRRGHVAFNGGERLVAEDAYGAASNIEKRIGKGRLSGDALRRQIEVLVQRGPCYSEDIVTAEELLEPHVNFQAAGGGRQSNDVIAMMATKVMLLRSKGNFDGAAALIRIAEQHEFVLRGECPFTARIELELEKYKLRIACNAMTPAHQRGLRLIAQELQSRSHQMLYWDTMLLLAETQDEPEKSITLDLVERQAFGAGWLRRRDAIECLRTPGRSAVKSFGC